MATSKDGPKKMSEVDPKTLPFDPRKLPDPDFKAPDVIGTVEGWRAWRVSRELPKYGVAPKLYSVSHGDYYWVPRKESVAECSRCGEDVPGEQCSCGFYSAKNLEHLQSMGYHNYSGGYDWKVIGQVACWGKVIEGSQGWRSQKAYPVKIWVPFEAAKTLGKAIGEAYGVEVRIMNFLRPVGQKVKFKFDS